MPEVVCDTSPLQYLYQLEFLDLLPALVGRVVVPPAVQEELSVGRALGITFQQVQKYERGANRVSASKLWEIAGALKTPVAYFYDGLGDQDALAGQRDIAQEFMMSTEGIELMATFPRISEPAIRRKIVELVRVVADEC